MIKAMRACARVSLLSLVHDPAEERRAADLEPLVDRIRTARVPRWRNRINATLRLPTSRPLTLELLSSPSVARCLRELVDECRPDVVLAYCSGMARYAMEPPLERTPWVLDMVDLDSEKWRVLGESSDWRRFIFRREASCLSEFERTAARAAVLTLAINPKEAEAVRRLAPEADVRVIGNGVDVAAFAPKDAPSSKRQVVFCGVLDYAPNEGAVQRLAVSIWPAVRRAQPDATLLIVGANPTAAIRALPARDPSVAVTGAVPDVKPYLWDSALTVVPLSTARGVQNKVLEALAAGLPAIVSRTVADGLPPAVAGGCAVADSDADFVCRIVEWLALSSEQRRALARRADIASLTWERQLAPLCSILEEAVAKGAEQRA
jgi:sugar transferase (PEP-CTERM/EpsH1 system associated)